MSKRKDLPKKGELYQTTIKVLLNSSVSMLGSSIAYEKRFLEKGEVLLVVNPSHFVDKTKSMKFIEMVAGDGGMIYADSSTWNNIYFEKVFERVNS